MRRTTPRQFVVVLVSLLILLVGVCLLCVQIGIEEVRMSEAFTRGTQSYTILVNDRLPRVLIAAMVGGALAASGVVFQALLRNPLADPYILGVSGGSALGAVISIAFGIELVILGFESTFLFAFAGACGALALVYSLARVRGQVPTYSLLLAGVIVNSFCGAAIIFLLTSVESDKGSEIIDWIVGTINVWKFVGAEDYTGLVIVALLIAAGFAVVVFHGRTLNLFALGERSAEQLGVHTGRARLVLLVATSLMTAAAVSISGPIGFVGLVIPHAMRLAFGPDHRLLAPASLLFGATFLVACDTFGRVAYSLVSEAYEASEVPVGVITAMLGGPFFLFLLRRRQRHATFSQDDA